MRVLSCTEGAEIRMCGCLDWNVQCSVSKRPRPNELQLEEKWQLPDAALTSYRVCGC